MQVQGLAQDAEKYKSTAAHVELSKKMYKRDPATAPVVGDRVPYVIIKVRVLPKFPLLTAVSDCNMHAACSMWCHLCNHRLVVH